MDKEQANSEKQPNNEQPADKATENPNVAEGKKAIEIQKQLGDISEEDAEKDAEQWRNEG